MLMRFCKYCNKDLVAHKFSHEKNKCDNCQVGNYNNYFIIPKGVDTEHVSPNSDLTRKRREREAKLELQQIENDFAL